LQLNTANILFICGGAFDGMEKIVRDRITNRRPVGFKGEKERAAQDLSPTELLRLATADDLLHFGLIPEFVGRIPVLVSVDPLDQEMLVKILTEPKNSIIKQYQRLFSLDHVELVFAEDALQAAAAEAMRFKTGARGLRTIIEEVLLDTMYEIPSRQDVHKCLITADTIKNRSKPLLFTQTEHPIDLSQASNA
jgi:ATP-dependent Clp protease ATP-binding subunit ClpX